MDAQRFDTLTKTLAGRLSRRTALRQTAAAAAASLLAATGLRAAPALAQDGTAAPVFTMIRRYRLSGPPNAVREALLRGRGRLHVQWRSQLRGGTGAGAASRLHRARVRLCGAGRGAM